MLRLAMRAVCGPIAVVLMALAPNAAAAPGDITTVAGTGVAGPLGDTGLATLAQLNAATAIAPLSGGGFLIADYKNNRVRKVSSTGVITTVAGTGTAGIAGDGGPATAAQLAAPVGVATLADGGFVIADSAANRIRMVSSSGVITTVAGIAGSAGFSGDGGQATSAQLNGPTDVRPTADGGLLITDYKNNRIRKVSSGGVITTVAGTGLASFGGDNGAATAAALNAPVGIDVASDGGYLVADMGNNRVRAVGADGTITTLAGTGVASFGGDGGSGSAAALNAPVGVALAADGTALIADSGNNRVRSIEPGPAPAPTPTTPVDSGPAPSAPAPAPVPVDAPLVNVPLEPAALARLAPVGLVLPTHAITVTRSGRVPLALRCAADAGSPCRGTVTLTIRLRSARASIARAYPKSLKIASAKFSVSPGKRATVKARLSKKGRKLLAKSGSLKVTAVISRRGGPNLGQKSQTTSFKIKRGKHRGGKKA